LSQKSEVVCVFLIAPRYYPASPTKNGSFKRDRKRGGSIARCFKASPLPSRYSCNTRQKQTTADTQTYETL
jgi:hypothetical protein